MLVLSRKLGESIVIDGAVTITVVQIRGDKVRLGIEAPKEVPVHRQEVFEKIQRSHQAEQGSETQQGPSGNKTIEHAAIAREIYEEAKKRIE